MYYLTAKDTDYQIKGSRDPLGFQVLWQAAGREVIPYISTVSNTVMDYQILLLAHAAKDYFHISDEKIIPFFIKLEQLLAYVRYQKNGELGFNGVDRVRKKYSTSNKQLEISLDNQILTNQKSYGIWGKYISSFRKMSFDKNHALLDIYKTKIQDNPLYKRRLKSFATSDVSQSHSVVKDELDEWEALIAPPTGAERSILIDNLLQSSGNNELLRLFTAEPNLSNVSFYDVLEYGLGNSENDNFKWRLKSIKETEQVLSPLNRIFRYLQTQSYWRWEELESNETINRFKNDTGQQMELANQKVRMLAGLMTLSNKEMIKGIYTQNNEVTSARDSAPWIGTSDSGVEVYHFEGEFFDEGYEYTMHNDFSYFLGTYQKLFRELHPN